MARAFSLASWNVEHFKDHDADRASRVVDFLATKLPTVPEVFVLYEVEGKDVYRRLMDRFPDHRFHQSEGKQLQEILVAVHKKFPAFVTQRIELKANNDDLRPGVLLTLDAGGARYSLLFMHLKSGNDPYALGLRYDMLESCFDLRKALNAAHAAAGHAGDANYVFLGDLNTMGGKKYPYMDSNKRVDEEDEIKRLEATAAGRSMRVLSKDEAATFSNDPAKSMSDLDHVVAAKHLQFKAFDGKDVRVEGWPKQTTLTAQRKWIQDYSDHAVLYLEVQA